MPDYKETSSESTKSQATLLICLGVIFCLIALIFLRGSSAGTLLPTGGYGGGGGYGGYGGGGYGGGYRGGAGVGRGLAPMLNWPQLLMLSFGATLVTVGIVTMRRESSET
jgi:hypothetical protein